MYVLDTNTLIYFFKGQGHVAANLLDHSPAEVAIPAIVLFELETGLSKSIQASRRRLQLDRLLAVVPVLPFTAETAREAGRLRADLELRGTPIGPMDTLIAATALEAGAPLVTRNTREFSRVPGLTVVDWHSEPPRR